MVTEPEIQPSAGSRRCTAICVDGSPCRAWAVHGTQPPRCAPHGGGRAPVGAPQGNQNARTHGFYAATPDHPPGDAFDIDWVIIDLRRKQERLSRYIDRAMDDLAPSQLARLLSIHAQNASRLGRLLRDRDALTGSFNEVMSQAVDEALAELSEEWGVDLTGPPD
jgi:hypothetical protein